MAECRGEGSEKQVGRHTARAARERKGARGRHEQPPLPCRGGILVQFLRGHTPDSCPALMGNRSCSLGSDENQPAELAQPAEELPPPVGPGVVFSDVQERAYREQFAFLDADVRVYR